MLIAKILDNPPLQVRIPGFFGELPSPKVRIYHPLNSATTKVGVLWLLCILSTRDKIEVIEVQVHHFVSPFAPHPLRGAKSSVDFRQTRRLLPCQEGIAKNRISFPPFSMPSLTILARHHLPPISSDYSDFLSHDHVLVATCIQSAIRRCTSGIYGGFLAYASVFCRTNDYPSSKMLHNFMLL